ncbi:hypothetical protein EDD85DRAFT_972925 [Armillaria nabsnona]|nr:hypothetical protein EDD85DRAFT_972925 [Armillaria nabsnona]
MNSTLDDLPDDVLIYIIAFLSVPDILLLRQTFKRFSAFTRLHIIWTNAFKLDIVSNHYPFPLDNTNLEHSVSHAYRWNRIARSRRENGVTLVIATDKRRSTDTVHVITEEPDRAYARVPFKSRWLTDSLLTTFIGLPVSKMRLVPGRRRRWLITVSKDIWSVQTIWDVTRGCKCSEWSPKSAIFTGVKLNADLESEAGVAVENRTPPSRRRQTRHEIRCIDANLCPVNITGNVIALSDNISKTPIYTWKTDEGAYFNDAGGLGPSCLHHAQHPRRLRPLHHSLRLTPPPSPP